MQEQKPVIGHWPEWSGQGRKRCLPITLPLDLLKMMEITKGGKEEGIRTGD